MPNPAAAAEKIGGLRRGMNGKGLTGWWKREWETCLKAVLLACLPIVACLVCCAARGQSIGQVYLPSSERNDELIYYKQVEAVLRYGYPQGYFGFNEGHALKLSFAAWSPILMLPWVLWGLAFGWNLLSPIVCNIVLLTAAMLLFGLLAKPEWKQVGLIALLFFLYQPFSWYMLSGMPEIGCMSLLIVFYGLAAGYLRRKRTGLLAAMFALAGLLTLMRPYLLLFLLLPAYFWTAKSGGARKKRRPAARWRGILGSGAILLLVLGGYAWLNHFLAAEYLRPLFRMDWLTAFFERGLFGGLRNFFGSLYYTGLDFLRYAWQGMLSGLASGAIFCCYIVMFLLLLYQSFRDYAALRRQKTRGEDTEKLSGQLALEGHLAFAFLGMLGALLLMSNFHDGCKHLLTFLAAGILVVSGMRTVYLKKAILTGAVFAYFFFYHGAGFEAYQPDFEEPAVAAKLESWNEALGRELALTGEERPNYDNTVIWVLTDELSEGTVYTGWQYLYALPGGFGISCCTEDYVTENFDSLQSGYLCVVPGGPIEERCRGEGYERIAGNEYAVFYRRY